MELNYTLEGEGETLVFIHGLSDSLLYWQPLINNLKSHYQILRYDLRGHGLSEAGDEKVSMDIYVEDLLSLLDELELKKVNIVGFSLGGAIALNFISKYPERVSSLVLMSSFYKSDEHLTKVFNTLKNALKKSFTNFYDIILPMVLCPEIIKENQTELKIIRNEASKTANTIAYHDAVDVCLKFDGEANLGRINVPVLVIAAKYDEFTLLSMQEELHAKISNSKMIVFDNVKHNILIGRNINKIAEILDGFY